MNPEAGGSEDVGLPAAMRADEPFREETHSFEFWFQSIEDQLHDRPYGISKDTRAPHLDEGEVEGLIRVLSTYCVGESAALEGASGLIRLAPNHATKIFLATQVADEARHLEALLQHLHELGVVRPEDEIERWAHPSLLSLRRRILELVSRNDWEGALFAQNIVLESMEFAAFDCHRRVADPRTAELLSGILVDERRHRGFGENTIGRALTSSEGVHDRLLELKNELDAMVLSSFQETLRAIGLSAAERPEVGGLYLETVARLGLDRS